MHYPWCERYYLGKTRIEDFMIESAVRAVWTDQGKDLYHHYRIGTPTGGLVVERSRDVFDRECSVCKYMRLASCWSLEGRLLFVEDQPCELRVVQ